MDPRIPARMALVALLATAGCAAIKPERGREAKDKEARRDDKVAQTTAFVSSSQSDATKGVKMLAPKRCDLTSVILTRPLDDPLLVKTLWQTVDDQSISPESRRLLAANGIRAGILSGGLPPEVERLLQEQTPVAERGVRTTVTVPDGSHYLVQPSPAVQSASLLVNLGDSATGKEYTNAKGIFRLTTHQDGPEGVSLNFLPEVHHGQVRNGYAAAPNLSPYEPEEFVFKQGQDESVFRELAIHLVVQPGQIAILGALSDRDRSLGDFFFISNEANSDRLMRSVVLIEGKPSNADAFGHSAPPTAQEEPPAFPLFKALKLGRDKDEDKQAETPEAEPAGDGAAGLPKKPD
ncbi:hypothetical protein EP7_000228 [Isosphaeraceae bacterium EP7]